MSESFTVRPVTEADFGALRDIFERGRRFQLSSGFEQWREGYPADDILRRDLDRGYGHTVVAPDGKLAGYYALVTDGDSEYDRLGVIWSAAEPYTALHRFVIDDPYRGRGTAEAALRHAERQALKQGIRWMRIDTGVNNRPMHALMERNGYLPLGDHTFVWGPRTAYDKDLGRRKITVSIVVHNTPAHLVESVLASLANEPVDTIYIVDNSSVQSAECRVQSEETVQSAECRVQSVESVQSAECRVQREFLTTRKLENWKTRKLDDSKTRRLENLMTQKLVYVRTENHGYGHAHNIAIRRAAESGATHHLVLNPDVRWQRPVLAGLVDEMERHDDCGLIQPRLTYPDGRLQHTCRLLPTPLDVAGKRFLPHGLMARRLERYLLPASAYARSFNAVYMQGSFLLFRMSALRRTGGFDERFFMYPEDIDITRRVRRHYSALYCPDFEAIHDHAAASSKWNRMLRIHIVNMARYFNKWGWFFDSERRRLNRQLLAELSELSGESR